jgi:hypothetical protein
MLRRCTCTCQQGHEEVKVNPSAFESLAGKGATRKWRQSLTVLPDGPHDVLVPQPLALGDFLKQYQLEKCFSAQQAPGRSSSAAAAAADEAPLLSPAAARYQHHPLVSPGVRRRRQQQGSQASSSQEQDWDAGEAGSDDQPQAHVKRSRGSKAQHHPKQRQQHLEDENDPAFKASMPAALPAFTQQHLRLEQHQLQLSAVQRGHPAAQSATSQELQDVVAGLHDAAAVSSVAHAGCQELQAVLQQQQQQPQLQHQQPHLQQLQQQQPSDAQPASSALPVHGEHWRRRSPQLTGNIIEMEQAALSQPSAVTSAAPKLEQQQPAVLVSLSERQKQPYSHAELQQQGLGTAVDAPHVPTAAGGPGSVVSAQPLLSPAGRPIRQLTLSRQRAAAAAAAAVAARYERGSHAQGYMGGIRYLQVWCDQLPGMLDLQRMQVVPLQGEVSKSVAPLCLLQLPQCAVDHLLLTLCALTVSRLCDGCYQVTQL